MSIHHETQTALGKRLGVSSFAVGHWLKALGLRDATGKPTPLGRRFCKEIPVDPDDESGRVFYVWSVYQVLPLLLEYQKTLAAAQGGAK